MGKDIISNIRQSGKPLLQLTPRGEPLTLQAVDVDHGHIGPAQHRSRDQLAVPLGFGDDVDVLLTGEQSGERPPHEAGLPDEKNADQCRSLRPL